ncbi:MAG: TIGR00269 family protein [Nanoarchaeota archaeon]
MKKCRCCKEAVFHRSYEGRYLCEQHFCESVERKVKRTIRDHRMVQKGDKIVIGVSGGKNSVSLLHIMSKTFGKVPGTELIAISINEGIKDVGTKHIKLAKKLCKKMGIEHKIYSFKKEFGKTMDQKVKEETKLKEPCAYCGVGRRYMLNKIAREMKADKLCVGNNLDNEAQSVLMNYIRGDMPRASRLGMITNFSISEDTGSLFVPKIKPLRLLPEEEAELYAKIKKLDAVEKKCPYNSGLRSDALKFVNELEEKYPGVRYSILETFDKFLPIIRNQVKGTKIKLKVCKKCGEPSAQEICKTCELWR